MAQGAAGVRGWHPLTRYLTSGQVSEPVQEALQPQGEAAAQPLLLSHQLL